MAQYLQMLWAVAQTWRKSVWEGDDEDARGVVEGEKDVNLYDPLKFLCPELPTFPEYHFTARELRETILASCSEFNRPEFFMAVQVALLIYYPGLALGIMYQYFDQELQEMDTQPMEQQMDSDMQCGVSVFEQQSKMALSDTQSQFAQFIQSVMSELTRVMTGDTRFIQTQFQTQQRSKTKRAAISASATTKTMMMSGDGESVRVGVMVKVPRHGLDGRKGARQGQHKDVATKTVWRTVYVAI
jgi:hypothetical protein